MIDSVDGHKEFTDICFNIRTDETFRFPKALFDQYWATFVRNIFVTTKREATQFGASEYFRCRMSNKKMGTKLWRQVTVSVKVHQE